MTALHLQGHCCGHGTSDIVSAGPKPSQVAVTSLPLPCGRKSSRPDHTRHDGIASARALLWVPRAPPPTVVSRFSPARKRGAHVHHHAVHPRLPYCLLHRGCLRGRQCRCIATPRCVAPGPSNHLSPWAPRAVGVCIVEHERPWVDMWLPSVVGSCGASAEGKLAWTMPI